MKKSYYNYERQHNWYLKNRVLCLKRANKYRINHREEIRIKDRAYRKQNPNKLWIARNNPTYRFSLLKSMAKRRGLVCNLTFSYYSKLASNPCYYCAGELPQRGHGVDRVNSNKGYTKGNVRPCCTNCNRAKNDLSSSQFLKLVSEIYNNRIKINEPS